MEHWFTMGNYGTMDKTMILWQKYGTIPGTIELRFTKGKNMVDYQKTKKLWFIMEKTMVIYQNNWSFLTDLWLQNFDLLCKNYGTMEKKLWHYGKNYGTIPKWDFDLLWKKLWYYEKTMVL